MNYCQCWEISSFSYFFCDLLRQRLLGFLVKARVLDSHGGAAPDVLRQLQVRFAVPGAGLRRDEQDR